MSRPSTPALCSPHRPSTSPPARPPRASLPSLAWVDYTGLEANMDSAKGMDYTCSGALEVENLGVLGMGGVAFFGDLGPMLDEKQIGYTLGRT